MKGIIILLFYVSISLSAMAQNSSSSIKTYMMDSVSIRGYIEDSVTHEGMPFAEIILLKGPNKTVTDSVKTDIDGHFKIAIPNNGNDEFFLRCAYEDYIEKEIEIEPTDRLIRINMRPESNDLPIVAIGGDMVPLIPPSTPEDTTFLGSDLPLVNPYILDETTLRSPDFLYITPRR